MTQCDDSQRDGLYAAMYEAGRAEQVRRSQH